MILGGGKQSHVRADVDENDAWRVPPNTRITCAVFAPELSATLTIDSC